MSTSARRHDSKENGRKSNEKVVAKRFNGVYEAPIDKLGWPGRLLRHRLLDAIVSGAPILVQIQKFRKPWLDTLMHVLSFMGTEDFYTGIIAALMWVVDLRFARLFTILMGAGFYAATASKNILRLPRPPSPPVAVLEKTYDWSLPSLHAVIGMALPGYLFFYPYKNYDMSSEGTAFLAFLIISWTACVCASRLYLGVHSIADIIVGLFVGSVVLFTYLQIDDAIDAFLYKSQYAGIQALVIYALVLAVHPQSGPPTHSFGETAVTCGVAFGLIMIQQTTRGPNEWYYTALLEHNSAKNLSGGHLFFLSVCRIIVGFPVVLLVRSMSKPLIRRIIITLCKAINVPYYSYSQFSRNNVLLNKHYNSGFRLPPIYKNEKDDVMSSVDVLDADVNNSKTFEAEWGSQPSAMDGRGSRSTLPLDVDNPTKFIVYTIVCVVAINVTCVAFFHLGLVAHTS